MFIGALIWVLLNACNDVPSGKDMGVTEGAIKAYDDSQWATQGS